YCVTCANIFPRRSREEDGASATTRLHASSPSAHSRLALARGPPAGLLLRETPPARTPLASRSRSLGARGVGPARPMARTDVFARGYRAELGARAREEKEHA